MPRKKAIEQSLMWLTNKIGEEHTLDSVNAAVCYNLILAYKAENERLGAMYHRLKVEYDKAKEELERYHRL